MKVLLPTFAFAAADTIDIKTAGKCIRAIAVLAFK
jgi:hypothetical protein